MVNISHRQLPEEILNKTFNLFFKIFSKCSSKETFFVLLNDFFTPKEKILLAKRITIIYLLMKGIEQNNIADLLKVSTSTVAKYALIFHDKESKILKELKLIIKREKLFSFMNDLLADFLIQPGVKIGHWKLYHGDQKRREREKTYGI